MKSKLLLILTIFLSHVQAQKVGVVLSGGGAAGSAHVGVLKSLEENNIPIDFIVGTSIGALVGAFYASGYSPEEIEALINSAEFRNAATGTVEERYLFYLMKDEDNSSVLSLNFNVDSVLGKNLPTNVISSVPIDYGLMELFSPANAVAKSNFDSLMIPYRAVAANISQQKQSILKNRDLSKAIRASMTYPFYISPITINGDLMFDGGLYNNFPVDIMCNSFSPDYIIASNVAAENPNPTEDNLLAQLRNILTKEANFEINCTEGIIIQTDVSDISTFDFYGTDLALQKGYNAANSAIDSIRKHVSRTIPAQSVVQKRTKFNQRKPQLIFDSLKIINGYNTQEKYMKHSLKLKQTPVNSTTMKSTYYKFTSNPKISSAYPTAIYDSSKNTFAITLDLKKEKKLKASFGGVVASKPFSTGFFQLEHKLLRNTELSTQANIYFGSFYNAAEASIRWDVPFYVPFYIKTKFSVNRFDYFNGRSTFIDDINPPYIINSERYWGTSLGVPIFTNGKLELGYNYLWQDYEYYQTDDFIRGDTSDRTSFEGNRFYTQFERNSLNRKQYATKGSQFILRLSAVSGRERTTTGSTTLIKSNLNAKREWFEGYLKFDKYLLRKRSVHLGLFFEGNISSLPLFQNYTASNLISPSFAPLPENRTIFQRQYRARSYAGAGIKAIYSYRDIIDIRAELYLYQPYEQIIQNPDGSASFAEEVETRNFIGTLTAVYHSRLGPLAANLNYYEGQEEQFSFLVHFGYVLFNKRGLE